MDQASLRVFKESGSVLLVLLVFALLAGDAIEGSVQLFEQFPVLLIVLPAFINACGSISDTVANHLTTTLSLSGWGYRRMTRELLLSGTGGVISAAILFTGLAGSVFALAPILGWNSPPLGVFVGITALTGIATVLLGSVTSIFIAYASTRFSWDPDNVETPILNTLSDWAGVYLFIWASELLLLTP